MLTLDIWDITVLVVAAYIAIVTLVRLVRRRRDDLVAHFQRLVEAEQDRKRAAELRKKHQEMRLLGRQQPASAEEQNRPAA